MGYLGDYMVRVTIWKLNMNYLPTGEITRQVLFIFRFIHNAESQMSVDHVSFKRGLFVTP